VTDLCARDESAEHGERSQMMRRSETHCEIDKVFPLSDVDVGFERCDSCFESVEEGEVPRICEAKRFSESLGDVERR